LRFDAGQKMIFTILYRKRDASMFKDEARRFDQAGNAGRIPDAVVAVDGFYGQLE